MTLRPHRAFIDEAREIDAGDPEEFDRDGGTIVLVMRAATRACIRSRYRPL